MGFNELGTLTVLQSQVQLPQFGATPTADALGAFALNQQGQLAGFNADMANQQALLNGLFGLGSAAITGATFGAFGGFGK